MHTLLIVLAGLILGGIIASPAIVALFRAGGDRENAWNSYSEIIHPNGRIPSQTAEGAFAILFLLAKRGVATGSIDVCGATDRPLGLVPDTPAVGDKATVIALGAIGGTVPMVPSKSIAAGAALFTTTGGKVTDTAVSGAYFVGVAWQAGTANIPFEVIPATPTNLPTTIEDASIAAAKLALTQDWSGLTITLPSAQPITPALTLQAVVDNNGATLTAAQSGGVISNLGASGAATFVLPPATAGLNFTFIVEAAQELRIDPDGTETIALPSSGVQQAAGKYITADAVGEKVKLVCLTAGTWTVEHYSGTWGVQG